MEFRILGPVEVWHAGRVVPIGAPMQRAVLAALLIRAGQTVSVDALVGQLWGGRAPRTARVTVRNYVQRLRHHIPGAVLETQPPGYRLCLDTEAVDLLRFERLLASARRKSPGDCITGPVRTCRDDGRSTVPDPGGAGWLQQGARGSSPARS